jgi:polyhydroxybutyrate depolymerase
MLVLGLHAGGSGLGGFISITRIEDRARRDGFIAVFPNGLNFVEGSASWNAMHCCGAAHPQNVDDVGFIRALIDQLRRDLAVDSRRIFATGMSNGAMLAHRLAAELSDLIAGIGPVCGTIGGQEDVYASVKRPTTPARAVPVIAFNGLRDTAVPYAGGAGSDGDGRLDLSVAESMAFWTAANGCASTAPQVEMLFNGKVVRRTFPCPAGAEVVHYTMAEGDHSWPRPSQPGVPDGFFAEDYILPFFVAHPRP